MTSGADAFTHVLRNILRMDEDSPLALALSAEGYDEILDIEELEDDEIASLQYSPTTGKKRDVPTKQKKVLLMLRDYSVAKAIEQGEPFTADNWIGTTENDFAEYRRQELHKNTTKAIQPSNVAIQPPKSITTNRDDISTSTATTTSTTGTPTQQWLNNKKPCASDYPDWDGKETSWNKAQQAF